MRVQTKITILLLTPPSQARYAAQTMLMPPGRVVNILEGVDTEFWRPPAEVEQRVVCSAGREMRDYGTLLRALDGTDIPCCIAARLVRGKDDTWRRSLGDRGEKVNLPTNVTFTPQLKPTELRDLYARSRFVVIPLHRSDTDNGINVLLESWAMGRAVICSDIDGLSGIVGFPHQTMRTRVVGSRGLLELDAYGKLLLGDGTGWSVVVEREPYDFMQLTSPGRLEQFIGPLGSLLRTVAADETPVAASGQPQVPSVRSQPQNGPGG